VHGTSPQSKLAELRFLIDTGANVSIISASVLNSKARILEGKVNITSCSGDQVDIQGKVALQVTIGPIEFPCLNFWITPQEYTSFDGIIRTDILASLDASIDFKVGKVIFNNLEEVNKEIYHSFGRAPAAVHKLRHVITPRQKQELTEVVATRTQMIPANSLAYIECEIRHTPFHNFPHVVARNTIHAAGVMMASTLVMLNEEGTFPIPVINLTDRPHKVRDKELLTFANPFLPGTTAMAG
jgi:hypothetical protein